MVYVGLDGRDIPDDFPLHHQVIVREPLGEGNSVFVSLSPAWDHGRGPAGHRAITLSSHTALDPWWTLHTYDPERYEQRKQHYTERLLSAAERVLPGISKPSQPDHAGHPCHVPALHPTLVGMGRRLSADRSFPGLGAQVVAKPLDGRRQHLSRTIDRGSGAWRLARRPWNAGPTWQGQPGRCSTRQHHNHRSSDRNQLTVIDAGLSASCMAKDGENPI